MTLVGMVIFDDVIFAGACTKQPRSLTSGDYDLLAGRMCEKPH